MVISVFIVGILLFFLNHMNLQLYSALDDVLEKDPGLNNTEAHQAIGKIKAIEETNIWDYAFLAIFIGLILQMLMFSFASRTNLAFFWIFILLGIIILIVGVILSNIWQDLASNPEFVQTILRFPIANAVLGTYYPTVITAILFLGMIILFGKFPGSQT